MVKNIIDYYMLACWLVPLLIIAIYHKHDERFLFRQWLFPLQYCLQVMFEKLTGNNRMAVRILQILSPILTVTVGLGGLITLLQLFNEHAENHLNIFILLYYLIFSSIAFWFQPRAGKIYKTK